MEDWRSYLQIVPKVQLPSFMHKYHAVQMETIEDRTKTTISLFLVENIIPLKVSKADNFCNLVQGIRMKCEALLPDGMPVGS